MISANDTRLLILGANGMLGHMLMLYMRDRVGLQAYGTLRSHEAPQNLPVQPGSLLFGVDVTDSDAVDSALDAIRPTVVINCVGLIKQRQEAEDAEQAILINSLLPHRLARKAADRGIRFIQISTDCVFSGKAGNYDEDSVADCTDLYGRSKLLGEVTKGNALTLRTSIIGPELNSARGLLAWFFSQSGSISGYGKAIFSGVTTLELARIIHMHILPAPHLRGLFHVSADPISKFDLLTLAKKIYGKDIVIRPDNDLVIDRSLNSTKFRNATQYVPPGWTSLLQHLRDYA